MGFNYDNDKTGCLSSSTCGSENNEPCTWSQTNTWYNGGYNTDYCSTTLDINEPSWWWIDLGYIQHVDKVRIFGRNDSCENCLKSSNMITVRIGNTLGNQNGGTKLVVDEEC